MFHSDTILSNKIFVMNLKQIPFYKQDKVHSHLCEYDANRSDRSGNHRCKGRSLCHQSPEAPCKGGIRQGPPLHLGCETSLLTEQQKVCNNLRE